MAWSIAEVSRMSGVTSRTLRHYDDIGLLPPAYANAHGRRFYEHDQLVRLQHILVLRELDLKLETIAEVLTGVTDTAAALRRHRRWLLAERDRFDRLADTVARTIENLEGGPQMSAEQMFSGFDPESEQAQRLAEEAEARWGDTARDAHQRVRGWSKEKWAAVNREAAAATDRLAALAARGLAPDDDEVLDAVDAHRKWLEHHWTPTAESYAGLGRLYVEDERFRAQYDAIRPGFAEFHRDAMIAYAERRMS